VAESASEEVDALVIQGSKHYDFSSLPMLSPLATSIGLKGPIDGKLVLEIINAHSVGFFNRYLKGNEKINLEQISLEYEEVQFDALP
jgi:hypothetical protein